MSVLVLSLGACAADDAVVDELAGDEADDVGKADADVFGTFYTVRVDERRCVSPLCGGWWVAKANKDLTKCADGVRRAECYVAGIEIEGDVDLWSRPVVLRGDLLPETYGTYGNLGKLVATGAWVAGSETGAPDGIWAMVEPNGVRCIAAPCEDKQERKLNSTLDANISDLDFEPSGATDDEIGTAWDAMTSGGLIVVGERYRVQVDGRRAKARTVTQFYVPVE